MNELPTVPEFRLVEFSLVIVAFLQVLTKRELNQAHQLCTFQLGEIHNAIAAGKVEYMGIDLTKRAEIIDRVRLEIAREYEKRINQELATANPGVV